MTLVKQNSSKVLQATRLKMATQMPGLSEHTSHVHVQARFHIYPRSDVMRATVPDNQVSWEVAYTVFLYFIFNDSFLI